jgi:acetoin utilization deacetylase AcuC-like enzyme
MAGLRAIPTAIVELEAPSVDPPLLAVVHDERYVDEFRRFCQSGGGYLDPDTYAVPASWDAALHAAGAGPAAVDALVRGMADTAFVAVRPPGHHAERAQAMGFCFFNNVAVTAAYLRSLGERVAIVDWDVHHGNGTQRTFYRDPDVLYVSLHEFPFYPGTGWVTETGGGPGEGATVNIAVPSGTSSTSYLAAFSRIVIPIVSEFAPDWLLVSAGYDAHRSDPLGGLLLETIDYATMAAALASVVPPSRTIAFLEGGYDLQAMAASASATVGGTLALTGAPALPSLISGSVARVVELAVETLSRYWEVV